MILFLHDIICLSDWDLLGGIKGFSLLNIIIGRQKDVVIIATANRYDFVCVLKFSISG